MLSAQLQESEETKDAMQREHSHEMERQAAVLEETIKRHTAETTFLARPILEQGVGAKISMMDNSCAKHGFLISKLKSEALEIISLNEDVEQANQTLREQLDNQTNRRDRIHSIEKVLRELQARLENQVGECEKLRSELDEANAERDHFHRALIVLRGEGRNSQLRLDQELRAQNYMDATAEIVLGKLGGGLEDWVRNTRAECMAQQDEIQARMDETIAEQEEISCAHNEEVDDLKTQLIMAEQETTLLREQQQQEQYDAGNGALELEAQKLVVAHQLHNTQSELSAQSQITHAAQEHYERTLQAIGLELMQMQTTVRYVCISNEKLELINVGVAGGGSSPCCQQVSQTVWMGCPLQTSAHKHLKKHQRSLEA